MDAHPRRVHQRRQSLAAAGVVGRRVGVRSKKAAETLDDKQAPLAGLVAAFIFAVQMLNFPVAAGTSGHLLGGVLAAVLVGPWAGASASRSCCSSRPCSSPTAASPRSASTSSTWRSSTPRRLRDLRRYPRRAAEDAAVVVGASAVAAVPLRRPRVVRVLRSSTRSAATATRSLGTVFAAMVGVHTLIGIGEGVITALTVERRAGRRPDLVYGARDLLPPLECAPAEPVAGR